MNRRARFAYWLLLTVFVGFHVVCVASAISLGSPMPLVFLAACWVVALVHDAA